MKNLLTLGWDCNIIINEAAPLYTKSSPPKVSPKLTKRTGQTEVDQNRLKYTKMDWVDQMLYTNVDQYKCSNNK